MASIKLTFLGTGTSTGVPQIGCNCKVCQSTDPHDSRLRTSALVETDNRRILIDCGPDFRQQILRQGSPDIDALLVTHSHYDHLGGIDDLRPYCYRPEGFAIYCKSDVAADIHTRMPYCFGPHRYPGAPVFDIHTIGNAPFTLDSGTEITPLPVLHTPTLPITGFRIGPLSYITDCKTMPSSTIDLLHETHTLVINALRHEEHPSHQTLTEALDIIEAVQPKQAFITHISHHMGRHSDVDAQLPQNVHLAYDGLTVRING